ncbi:hypothetical protein M758_8G175100 [Ceratodon purpureus]|uniref:Uncharacterized protein n=1 Tax=Ceratodon purpureus TaxID=3225 RepID=A0A8T0H579_CERPU|nr:hypothetical protein KC19_8G180300 [Ceratodon purpureus]KAG0609309.1 hypothetical protein M758_8G175100 [Ceratodon purpureus]
MEQSISLLQVVDKRIAVYETLKLSIHMVAFSGYLLCATFVFFTLSTRWLAHIPGYWSINCIDSTDVVAGILVLVHSFKPTICGSRNHLLEGVHWYTNVQSICLDSIVNEVRTIYITAIFFSGVKLGPANLRILCSIPVYEQALIHLQRFTCYCLH